ncbi:glycosyltransferase 87 family protein [Streptomyces goshikiensis]|uniref:glycosyltransferase 87 family protein n=1 Tax=Streptomyces goshikiensis TaxID=1942 RepID=UPI003682096A
MVAVTGAFASARLWFLAGFLASVAGAVRVLTRGGDLSAGTRGISRGVSGPTGALWLLACPVVALPLSIGGVDPPVIGLLCLALAFTQRGRAGRAGLAVGVAAALKWTAWTAMPVIVVVLAVRGGKRPTFTCAAAATGLAALSAVGVGTSLLVRPPRTIAAAGDRLALGLLLAIALSPATRIGYAVYPIVLIAWPRSTARLSEDRPAEHRPPGGPPYRRRVTKPPLVRSGASS